MEKIRFLTFADFHYCKKMYPSSLAELDCMMERGKREQAQFVLQMGDFSNNLHDSPELEEAFLHNRQGLPVFGVYGNHELEQPGNTMSFITPRLTNCPDKVHFGTSDGTVQNGSIGHYYFDTGSFRIIALDSFYSLRPDGVWEHNPTLVPRPGNILRESLGAEQLAWLRRVVLDAADKALTVLVFSHASFCGLRDHSPDSPAVQKIFREANARRPHTVVLAMNGHYHTNHFEIIEDVAYFDVNVVTFGHWLEPDTPHYADTDTYSFTDYDATGKALSTVPYPFNKTYGGLHGWFFREPLSAMVTVDTDGHVQVEGAKSSWILDVLPQNPIDGTMPEISDFCC